MIIPPDLVRFSLVLLVVIGSGSAIADEPKPSGFLTGKVVDHTGKPVAGASIVVQKRGESLPIEGKVAESRTDPEGKFRIGPIDAFATNHLGLCLDVEGYARYAFSPDTITVYEGMETELGTIRVQRGRVYKAQVIDLDGKPRAGALVEVRVYRHILGHSVEGFSPMIRLETDENGRFTTPPLPVGSLRIIVKVPERRVAYLARSIEPSGEEDLGRIQLENDTSVSGTIVDEEGQGIAGVMINGTLGIESRLTDVDGRFTLRGFDPNPRFQLNARKVGYEPVSGMVTVTKDGISIAGANFPQPLPNGKDLVVTLKRVGWIEGKAVDADSGQPVKLQRVVVSSVERKPDGEFALTRIRSQQSRFPEIGQFRAAYLDPGEHHISLEAEGYREAEAFIPPVSELKTIAGIAVRMRKNTDRKVPIVVKQSISGTVTRDGKPLKTGWAVLRGKEREMNAINAPILRGRTVGTIFSDRATALITEGTYTIDVPAPGEGLTLVIYEPGHAVTQVGLFAIAPGEFKTLDVACTEGAVIRGRVNGVPTGWEGQVWVIAFNNLGIRTEAPVDPSGAFTLPALPPGEYGLKVGHDAYEDAETFPRLLARDHPESSKLMTEPWKRARVVKVEPGKAMDDVEVDWPQ